MEIANEVRSKPFEFSELDAEHLNDMPASELDRLPYGAIKLDRRGKILAYNATESQLMGLKAADVLGRNFFRDVAPCTHTPEFYGRFERGIAAGRLNETFEYAFVGRRRISVWIHMVMVAAGEFWLLVKQTCI